MIILDQTSHLDTDGLSSAAYERILLPVYRF